MVKKAVIKIFGSLACLLLCFILTVSAVAVPFYYSITALTVPEAVAQVVQKIDYVRVINDSPNLQTALNSFGIKPKQVENFMKSDKAQEIITVYADEMTEILLSIPESRMLDLSLVKETVNENLDVFIDIAADSTGVNFSKSKVKKQVNNYIKENEAKIEKALPAVEDTRTVIKTIMASTLLERSLTLKTALILTAAVGVIIALIFIIKRTAGFLWLGISLGTAGALLGAVIAFNHSFIINRAALRLSAFEAEIIESAVTVCTEKILPALCISVMLAFFLLAFYIALICLKKKYSLSIAEENRLMAE